MSRQALIPLLASLALATSACTSVSVYQTGKTLPKGKGQMGYAMGGGKARTKAAIPGFDVDLPSLTAEFWGRYGFTSRAEAGLKYSLPGSLTVDARYGILREIDGAPVSLAAGLGFAASSVSTEHSTFEDKTSIRDLIVPLYVSRDLSDGVSAYVTPRYVRRFIANERTEASPATEYINADMLGMGGGLMFNLGKAKTTHLTMEYQLVYEPADPSHYTQNTGMAIAFDF